MKQTTFTQDHRGLTSATQLVIVLAVILLIAVLYLTRGSWRDMLDYQLLFFIIMVVTGTYIGYSLVAAGRGRGTTLGIWDILFITIASGLFIIVLFNLLTYTLSDLAVVVVAISMLILFVLIKIEWIGRRVKNVFTLSGGS